MFRLLIQSIVVASTLTSCVSKEEPRIQKNRASIINGHPCPATELHTAAALIVDADFQDISLRTPICTATLIAPDVALTAAHCIDPTVLSQNQGEFKRLDFFLSFTTDLSGLKSSVPLPTDAIAVRKVVKHAKFYVTRLDSNSHGLTNFYDIALLFLETPVKGIAPALVMTPEEAKNLRKGDEVQIAGWGRRTVETSKESEIKYCASTFINEIGDFELQIGNEASSSRKCHGDSGGPTFITIDTPHANKERVIGATSRTYDSSGCQKGGIDTFAPAWYEWIDQQMLSECNAKTRAWCDVEGIIDPSYYDTDINGGCSFSQESSGLGSILILLFLLMLGRRHSFWPNEN